ncbi:CsbD family protein [uncultured Microbacterium sp.]|uniref:CsbD family protein n=1 Tax=uncultured Microbacterium sp. TaxID=191216 RepID=UPI0028DBC9A4|nr:CsbD family protein [uncultured Microbacterium sp.]
MSGTDDIKNNAEKLAGKVKEGVGKATDNDRLEAEGHADQTDASVKQAGENVKDAGRNVKDAFDH